MFAIRAALVTVLAVTAPLGSGSAPAASGAPVLTVAGSPEQQALVEDAAATFAVLGMPLPDLEIRFHDDVGHCDGHLGMFRPDPDGWTIDVCSTLAFVVPHELGHGWERATLSEADREQYMNVRGFDTWRNDDRAESAMEDVAFVVQLVVLGEGRSGRPDIDAAFDLLMQLAA